MNKQNRNRLIKRDKLMVAREEGNGGTGEIDEGEEDVQTSALE